MECGIDVLDVGEGLGGIGGMGTVIKKEGREWSNNHRLWTHTTGRVCRCLFVRERHDAHYYRP